MFLSVVMPAYNEEASIEAVILDHVCFFEKLGSRVPQWELVCVVDVSLDRIYEILVALSRLEPRLRVMRNENKRGIFGGVHPLLSGSPRWLHLLHRLGRPMAAGKP